MEKRQGALNQILSQEYEAWIVMELSDSCLEIKAFCQSADNGEVKYKLETKKTDSGGEEKTSHSGFTYLRSMQKKCLLILTHNISSDESYEIRLNVYRDGVLVAEDSVAFSPSKQTVTL